LGEEDVKILFFVRARPCYSRKSLSLPPLLPLWHLPAARSKKPNKLKTLLLLLKTAHLKLLLLQLMPLLLQLTLQLLKLLLLQPTPLLLQLTLQTARLTLLLLQPLLLMPQWRLLLTQLPLLLLTQLLLLPHLLHSNTDRVYP
jgi:hypothetical protein